LESHIDYQTGTGIRAGKKQVLRFAQDDKSGAGVIRQLGKM
jgi:hypothetical protein